MNNHLLLKRSSIMTHKKILTAAIAAALSIGGGTAQAASILNVTSPSTIDNGIAYELFSPVEQTLPAGYATLPENCATTSCFQVEYHFDENITKLFEDFDVKLTLKNAIFVENEEPELIVTSDGTTEHEVQIDATGFSTDFTTKHVAADADEIILNGSPRNYLKLKPFQIKVLEKNFAQSGQQVELTITLSGSVNDERTVVLAKTVAGYTPSITPTSDTQISEIDVEAVGKAFTSGQVNDVMLANLGNITFSMNTDPTGKNYSTPWSSNLLSESARVTNLPVLPDGAEVYFDNDSDCSSSDFDGTLDGTEAEWATLNTGNLNHYLCVRLPDGNTDVIGQSKLPAKLFFTANYGAQVLKLNGNLGHVKRNGALCNVFVVTNNGMQDISNVRVTNLSTKDAIVIGTLRNMQNEIIFEDVELAAIPAKGTVRLSGTDLEGEANMDAWTNRGVLTVGGTIPTGMMELFLLLRKTDDATGQGAYPLINMSLGASGNACE